MTVRLAALRIVDPRRVFALFVGVLFAIGASGCMTINCNVKDACRPAAASEPSRASEH